MKGWFLDWTMDGEGLFLIDEMSRIYQYDFTNETLELLFDYGKETFNPFLKATIAPNNLFFVQDDSLEDERIRIFGLDGQIWDIKEPFLFAMQPIWIPSK